MSNFNELKKVLNSYNRDVTPLAEGKRKKIEEAKAKYNSAALPEELKKIEATYTKALNQTREIHKNMLEDAVRGLRKSNSGKYVDFRIDYDLLQKMNMISQSGVKLTAEEIKHLCELSLVARSEFCVRKCQDMARENDLILNVPNEQAANKIIDDAAKRIKEIIEKFDGDKTLNNKTGGYMTGIKLSSDGGFLDKLEQDYNSLSLSDIEIVEADPEKEQQEKIKIPDNIGIGISDNAANSPAAKYAREHSERMSASSIEVGSL